MTGTSGFVPFTAESYPGLFLRGSGAGGRPPEARRPPNRVRGRQGGRGWGTSVLPGNFQYTRRAGQQTKCGVQHAPDGGGAHTHTQAHRYTLRDTHTHMHTDTHSEIHTLTYTQAHRHTQTHAQAHTFTHSQMDTHSQRQTHSCTHRLTHTLTQAHTRRHTYTFMYPDTHTQGHTHTHTLMHSQTDTHRHTNRQRQARLCGPQAASVRGQPTSIFFGPSVYQVLC